MQDHRLAAIMFTDIIGYTALMGKDEDSAVELIRKNRNIHNQYIHKFNGSLIKEVGDGILASFQLASEAVRCAIEIQRNCIDQRIPLKIGVHEGEIIVEGDYTFAPDPAWCRIVEFYCPGCGVMVENEYLPPGHPLTHDIELDIDKLKKKYL